MDITSLFGWSVLIVPPVAIVLWSWYKVVELRQEVFKIKKVSNDEFKKIKKLELQVQVLEREKLEKERDKRF